MTGVLLIGNLRSSLPLARELRRAGHAIHCGVDQPDPYLHTSRWVEGWFPHDEVDGRPEPILTQVERYLGEHPEVTVIAPVSDNAARLFSANRERFAGRVTLAVANPRAMAVCTDKAASFELCERLGVPIAPRRIVEDRAALLTALTDLGFPCVVKPVDSSQFIFGRKALIVRSLAEATQAVPHWPDLHDSLCVQRYVAGRRHDVIFAASGGRLLGAVDLEIVRSDKLDGSGYAVETRSVEPAPFVRTALAAFADALDYDGVGALQFMIDPATGEATFLELNPRLSACYRAAEVCGLPQSRLLVEIAQGRAPEPPADPWSHAVGRRVAWIKGDLAGFKRELRASLLSPPAAVRWLLCMARAAFYRHHLTFDPRDPAPTFWLYLHPILCALGLRPGARRRSGKAAPLPKASPFQEALA